MKTREEWNGIFLRREHPLAPEPALVQNLHLLKGPAALDLGAGDGRNALFLAENGFSVTAADYAPAGLAKIRERAGAAGFDIRTMLVDLDRQEEFSRLQPADAVICIHFMPPKSIRPHLHQLVNPGGSFFIHTFGARTQAIRNIHPDFILHPDQFMSFFPGFQLILQDEHQDDRGSFISLVIKRPA